MLPGCIYVSHIIIIIYFGKQKFEIMIPSNHAIMPIFIYLYFKWVIKGNIFLITLLGTILFKKFEKITYSFSK